MGQKGWETPEEHIEAMVDSLIFISVEIENKALIDSIVICQRGSLQVPPDAPSATNETTYHTDAHKNKNKNIITTGGGVVFQGPNPSKFNIRQPRDDIYSNFLYRSWTDCNNKTLFLPRGISGHASGFSERHRSHSPPLSRWLRTRGAPALNLVSQQTKQIRSLGASADNTRDDAGKTPYGLGRVNWWQTLEMGGRTYESSWH